MNEIQLYNNKQIIGGFLLIIMLAILFASNILLNSGSGLNISYFVAPVVLTISILCIYYVIALNKSIKNTYDRYIRPTKYKYKNCPNNYTTEKRNYILSKEIKCIYDTNIEHYDLIGSGYCGSSAGSTSTSTSTDCKNQCETDQNCYGYSSDSNNNNCYIYDNTDIEDCEDNLVSKDGNNTYRKKVPDDKRIFFLEGGDTDCGNEGSRTINGCFNHYDTTNTQCNKIFDYFDRNKYILSNDNWPEFKNMCILDPNPKVD